MRPDVIHEKGESRWVNGERELPAPPQPSRANIKKAERLVKRSLRHLVNDPPADVAKRAKRKAQRQARKKNR